MMSKRMWMIGKSIGLVAASIVSCIGVYYSLCVIGYGMYTCWGMLLPGSIALFFLAFVIFIEWEWKEPEEGDGQ